MLAMRSSSRSLALPFALVALLACDDNKATPPQKGSEAPTSASVVAPQTAPSGSSPVIPASATPPSTPPESIACQHVLVAYKGAKSAPAGISRSKAEAKTRATEARDLARGGTEFAEVAKTYSDDAGSRERLGSVGKFKREAMVKPFSDAAFALPVGGISEVVETPFGFHVIKRNQ